MNYSYRRKKVWHYEVFKEGAKKPIAHSVKGPKRWHILSVDPDWLLVFDAGQLLEDAKAAFKNYAMQKGGCL